MRQPRLTDDIQQALAAVDTNLRRKGHHHKFSQRQEFGLPRKRPDASLLPPRKVDRETRRRSGAANNRRDLNAPLN